MYIDESLPSIIESENYTISEIYSHSGGDVFGVADNCRNQCQGDERGKTTYVCIFER